MASLDSTSYNSLDLSSNCELLLSSGTKAPQKFEPFISRASNELPANENWINKLHSFNQHYLLMAAGTKVFYWDLRNLSQAVGSLFTNDKEVHSFASNSSNIFTGDKFHSVKQFEIKNMELQSDNRNDSNEENIDPESNFTQVKQSHMFRPPHFDCVNSLIASDTDLITGSKDGNIKHFDLLSR